MADDTLPVQSGILDPLVGMGFFSPNMSLEEIKRRRAIGAALASRARPFPKTIGEGMTALGEAFGERLAENRLLEAEKGYNERYNKAAGVPVAGDTLPPIVPAPAIATPTPAPPAPVGAMTSVNPLTVEPATGPASREAIAQVLARRNGAVPPGPTVTTGSPPPPLPTVGGPLVSRNASLDNGATFAEEGGSNPPTVNRDIRPMVMAQAGPPAAPVQPTARPGGTLEPVIPESLPRPEAPLRSERPTPNEQRWQNILRQFPGDPRAEREFKQAHELGKAARDAEYERQKAEHDVKLRAWEARETARQNALTSEPKTRLELQQQAAAATKAQADEQARLQWGNLPAPVQKDLFESRDAAKAAAGSIGALNNAEAALDAGTAIGPGSVLALAYHKTRAFAGNKESERILANTQSFQASLGPAVMAAVKSYGGPQVSNTDREYAAMMTGADVTLSEPAVRKILDIARRSAKAAMEEHRAKADEHAKDAPSLRKFLEVSDPLAASPKMSEGSKPAAPAAAGKTYNEGDIARGKPGQPDLIRRGGKWVPL